MKLISVFRRIFALGVLLVTTVANFVLGPKLNIKVFSSTYLFCSAVLLLILFAPNILKDKKRLVLEIIMLSLAFLILLIEPYLLLFSSPVVAGML